MKQINGFPGLRYFDDLDAAAKAKAMQEILDEDRAAIQFKLNEAREQVRKSVHAAVNDRHFIARLKRDLAHLRKVSADPVALYRYIDANLCMFTPGGLFQPVMISYRSHVLPLSRCRKENT